MTQPSELSPEHQKLLADWEAEHGPEGMRRLQAAAKKLRAAADKFEAEKLRAAAAQAKAENEANEALQESA